MLSSSSPWSQYGKAAESRHFQQHDREPEQFYEPFELCMKSESFLPKIDNIHVDNVNGDNFGASRGEPAASSGASNASPSCVSDVSCRSDKIAEPMVIPAQSTSR